ncbi:MAG: queuosine salvage family protein [bacterium]
MPRLRTLLARRPDPLGVLVSTVPVVEHARHVRIDHERLARVADGLARGAGTPPPWHRDELFFDGGPRSVAYVFLVDAVNFCFWGEPRWQLRWRGRWLDGYWALAAALTRAVARMPALLDADLLAGLEPRLFASIFRGRGELPLVEARWRNVRELGRVLRDRWDGRATRLVDAAGGSAPALARLVAESFSSFDDVALHDGREVRFFKRAQILVADLWGAFGGERWGAFRDIDQLTAFADYKLPQVLRAWGILRYAPALAARVGRRVLLAPGSPEEVEIRAATIWAVELLREALAARGSNVTSTQVDWILWDAGQRSTPRTKPYHRTRTIYY